MGDKSGVEQEESEIKGTVNGHGWPAIAQTLLDLLSQMIQKVESGLHLQWNKENSH